MSRIRGLILFNNGDDPNNAIDIAAGAARDSTNVYELALPIGITKRLDAAWAPGTGGGGLLAGAKAANTSYHVHLIRRDADGLVDVGLHPSAAAPPLPSGWSARRRIGPVVTDGAGNIRPFRQTNDGWFHYKGTPPTDVNGLPIGPTPVLWPLSVPKGIKVRVDLGITVFANTPSGGGSVFATDPDLGAPSVAAAGLGTGYHNNPTQPAIFVTPAVFTDTAGQLYFADSQASAATIYVYTRGWQDHRDEDL